MNDLGRQILQAIRRRCDEERGVALIIVAGSMIALTSAVALAVDVGMLTATRAEAQRVADAAAMAGAGLLIQSPDKQEPARAWAIRIAGQNTIRGQNAVVLPEDVDVDLDAHEVTVRVLRTEERGNPVGTYFARIFGVNTVDISADATAWASPAGGISCLLPVALPDRWREAGGPGNDPVDFNPELGDEYIPWQVPGSDPPEYNDNFTGYEQDDIGDIIVLQDVQGNGSLNPSWYYPWRPPGQAGASDFKENVVNCVNPNLTYGVGEFVDTEPGKMKNKVLQGFRELINKDPDAVWHDELDCIIDQADVLHATGGDCRSSPRIRPVPLFNPEQGPHNGASQFEFTNFAGLFVEKVEGEQVIARWIGYTGFEPADPDEGITAGPQFQVVQLID